MIQGGAGSSSLVDVNPPENITYHDEELNIPWDAYFIRKSCRLIEKEFRISRKDYGLAYCDELGGNNLESSCSWCLCWSLVATGEKRALETLGERLEYLIERMNEPPVNMITRQGTIGGVRLAVLLGGP
jgi:hypothetical protein